MTNPFIPVPSRGSLSKAVESQIESAIRAKKFVPGANCRLSLNYASNFRSAAPPSEKLSKC